MNMHERPLSLASDQTHRRPPVHALTTLYRCLDPMLAGVHQRRRGTLFAAVAACVSAPQLTLSGSGRRFTSKTRLRHGIKRADRLLGNGKLQGERRTFYAALCRVLLARVAEPVILVD